MQARRASYQVAARQQPVQRCPLQPPQLSQGCLQCLAWHLTSLLEQPLKHPVQHQGFLELPAYLKRTLQQQGQDLLSCLLQQVQQLLRQEKQGLSKHPACLYKSLLQRNLILLSCLFPQHQHLLTQQELKMPAHQHEGQAWACGYGETSCRPFYVDKRALHNKQAGSYQDRYLWTSNAIEEVRWSTGVQLRLTALI